MAQEDDDQAPPLSLKERIAKLQNTGGSSGTIPGTAPPYNNGLQTTATNSTNGTLKAKPPPPPPPSQRPTVPPRPSLNGRAQSSNVPPTQNHGATNGTTGTQPEESVPKIATNGTARPGLPSRTSTKSSNGPSLPPRQPSGPSPSLPPRKPSEAPSNGALSRKASQDSMSSVATARSSVSARSGVSTGTSITSDSQGSRFTIRAPAYDPNSLPPLPPKRTQAEKEEAEKTSLASARRPLKSSYSAPVSKVFGRQKSSDSAPTTQQAVPGPPPPPRVNAKPPPPPPLPGRGAPVAMQDYTQLEQPQQQQLPRPPLAQPPRPKQSALTLGFGNKPTQPIQTNQRIEHEPSHNIPPPAQSPEPPANNAPPPVPTSSRPDLTAILASKPKPDMASASHVTASQQGSCLKCRDFSGPDNHAARFPRQSLPTQDLQWLATQLTQPFPSPTDKARAIFTWLHHNVAYDVESFFNNRVGPSTPASTLQTGLAVCQGYADLFATLAIKAGLQATVVSGHGKGYSHTPTLPHQTLPPFKSTHAWNAVSLDNNSWQLIDPCWGAGNVSGPGKPFTKCFKPEHFTKSNNDFGLSHFPEKDGQQYRSDGCQLSWEQYIRGNKTGTAAHVFSGYVAEEGVDEISIRPRESPISISTLPGPAVRFQFQKVCQHWDPLVNGKGAWYLYTLHLSASEGSKGNHVPFRQQGGVWWCDVPVQDLGGKGAKVSVNAVTRFDGREGRGLTVEEFLAKSGRVGMSWGGVARWEVGA